jgi:hypothetical protein
LLVLENVYRLQCIGLTAYYICPLCPPGGGGSSALLLNGVMKAVASGGQGGSMTGYIYDGVGGFGGGNSAGLGGIAGVQAPPYYSLTAGGAGASLMGGQLLSEMVLSLCFSYDHSVLQFLCFLFPSSHSYPLVLFLLAGDGGTGTYNNNNQGGVNFGIALKGNQATGGAGGSGTGPGGECHNHL